MDRVLRGLPRALVERELQGGLMTASNPMRRALMSAAPKLTGRAAAKVSRRRVRKTEHSATVLLGWFRDGFYLVFEEYGTAYQPARPFARPVWDAGAAGLLDAFGEAMGKRLEKAARRAAGSYRQSGFAPGRSRRR